MIGVTAAMTMLCCRYQRLNPFKPITSKSADVFILLNTNIQSNAITNYDRIQPQSSGTRYDVYMHMAEKQKL